MEEYFDIYDKDNLPLGLTKKRSEVHRDGDWHRTAHIYVVNDKGQFLVHLRSLLKDSAAGKWDTRFGGHVTAGKTYEETAIAELKEEIGLDVNIKDLIEGPVFHYDGSTNKEHIQSYVYRFDGEIEDLKFNDNEVVEVKWMPPKKIEISVKSEPQKWGSMLTGFEEICGLVKRK